MKTKEFTLSAIENVEDITFGHIVIFEQMLHAIHNDEGGNLTMDNVKVLLGITRTRDELSFKMRYDLEDDTTICSQNECPTCPIIEECFQDGGRDYSEMFKNG